MRLCAGFGQRPPRRGSQSRGRGLSVGLAVVSIGAVAASALATLGAAPLLAWRFGEVSIVGLLANPIVVPVMGWGALGLGLTGMALVPIDSAAASLAFAGAGLCVRFCIAVATAMAEWPLAVMPLDWRTALVVTAATASLAWPAATPWSRVRHGLAGAAVATAFAIAGSPTSPPLRASFLDVGQGDAALVELGPGMRFLVDGGGLPNGREPGPRVLLPALRRRAIDRLEAGVVSHPDWDHFGGLETVVREGKAAAIWWAGWPRPSAAWQRFEVDLSERGVPLHALEAGRAAPLARSRGAIEVLHPSAGFRAGSANEASLVLRVRYGAASVLFTGDVEGRAEAALVGVGAALGATVLKVPHHGSATSSGEDFVRAVRPALAIASAGRGNRFRFPAPAVVERYRAVGSAWASTDRTGEWIVESDGQLIRVQRCRPEAPPRKADGARW
jgi:competence protein ComEC